MRKLLTALRGDPVVNARESVKEAMKVVCLLEAKATYHRTMRDFHGSAAAGIDPNQDWWTFAREKEAEKDEKEDLQHVLRRVDTARAKLGAHRARLSKLQGELG